MVLLLRAAIDGEISSSDGVQVVCGYAQLLRKNIEHAGSAYQDRLVNGPLEDETSSSEKVDDETRGQGPDTDKVDPHWELKKVLARPEEDFYELLGLQKLRWRATEDDIRKAFRKISLKYHPDKVGDVGESGREAAEEYYKRILKAYELLSDKKKRAAYDSVDEVDDSIPTESEVNAGGFYEKLSRAFDTNARWSENRMPRLGDDETAYEEVDRFYDAWFRFKSWREFTLNQEYDPDQADCREERRWMERQNAKVAKGAKQAENARIRKLVELAYRNDPRLKKRREEEKRIKEQAKEEKKKRYEEAQRAIQLEQEQAQKRKEEEEAKLREKALIEKKERDKQKRVLRKTKQRVREAAQPTTVDSIELTAMLEEICNELQQMELNTFAEGLESTEEQDLEKAIRSEKARILRRASEDQARRAAERANGLSKNKKMDDVPWTEEEKSMLSKALAKFPGGTRDRWERVAEFVQTKNAAQCLAKVNSSKTARAQSVAAKTQKPDEGKRVSGGARKDVAVLSDGPPNSFNFSKKQQAALEAAMKQCPPSLGDARWTKVAEKVSQKTADQCEGRYKELVTFFKQKKEAQQKGQQK
ncbi:hypothetical protein NDN08_003359 [Rhodosorus marinus]|uniref:DnaJ homolog subfamily C member 2 n=1 Tax=Rhodosorus marinus TaxID=101924 RepID=A0AAV8UWA4_9RHOD|nr:hypothetical protein NDN08_003359 [Rhodosorus marinus]